ncbi:DUF445 domain-containing protein [Halobacteriovorax sp. HLS]|uniref:DUF445 domain-containing protein n=1 Tax=Halobacteriovorax sp. HLS TaxID=2234000 RepID=UPI000FD6D31E
MNKSLLTNIISISLIVIGYITPYFSEQIKVMGLYSFSGAITNWLAIHMLFEKVPGLYGSGIITERFQEFKTGIRALIMNQFFTRENFEKFMSESTTNLLKIEEDTLVETIDFDKVFEKLKAAIMESPFGSMIGMFGGPSALDGLKPQFELKFKEIIADMINDENFIKNLTKNSEGSSDLFSNVEGLVDGRLNELTPKMVKEIIQDMIKSHLGWLVVWGGVFGALIGLLTTLL